MMKSPKRKAEARRRPAGRSPVPPAGGPMGKAGYDRPSTRRSNRKEIDESLPETSKASKADEREVRWEEAGDDDEEE